MFNFNRYQLIAAGVIVVLAFLGTGILVAKSCVFNTGKEVKLIEPKESGEFSSSPDGTEQPQTLCVHVAGKVNKPGVYDLKPGSRLQDAVKAAGGTLPNADLESINLAEKLQDGQQIYIALKGQIPPPAVSVVKGGAHASARSSTKAEGGRESSGPTKLTTPGQGTVNINTAGLDELQRLPGVGPATAQKIMDYRTQNGRFNAVDELDEVKGIGPAKLAKMRSFVTI